MRPGAWEEERSSVLSAMRRIVIGGPAVATSSPWIGPLLFPQAAVKRGINRTVNIIYVMFTRIS
jgi:hypothetical protein